MKDQANRIQGRTESGEEVVSGCCPPKSDASDGFRKIKATICPACSTRGKPVRTITVKSLVRDHTQVPLDVNFFFCDASNCRVVYFSEGPVFLKADLKIRVGFKEQEDPLPLYYCFGYHCEDVRRDIESSGTSDIPARIKAEVQAGFCACASKNPSGTCCLGDVNRAVKELKEKVVCSLQGTGACV